MKKKALSLICIITAAFLLCSCSGGTELFGSRGTSPYVKLGDYKNLSVDQNGDEYKDYYEILYLSDISAKNLYERTDEGAVQLGDYANIDFVGTVDGVAFEGGTDSEYDLLIGSGSFIDGFEDGLIGVSVGQTTELHLKFPENYQSEDLAGKATVFTVTVNYRRVPYTIDRAYAEMGFDSVEDYEEDLNKRCFENFVVRSLVKCCTIKETPDKDKFTGVVMLAYYDEYCLTNMGKDIKTYLKEGKQDINTFTDDLVTRMADGQLDGLDEITTIKNAVLAFYALYEKAGLSYDTEKLGKTTSYERCFDEFMLVKDAANEYLYENVKLIEKTDD